MKKEQEEEIKKAERRLDEANNTVREAQEYAKIATKALDEAKRMKLVLKDKHVYRNDLGEIVYVFRIADRDWVIVGPKGYYGTYKDNGVSPISANLVVEIGKLGITSVDSKFDVVSGANHAHKFCQDGTFYDPNHLTGAPIKGK